MYVKTYALEREANFAFSLDYPVITLNVNADVGTVQVRTSYNKLKELQKELEKVLQDFQRVREKQRGDVEK